MIRFGNVNILSSERLHQFRFENLVFIFTTKSVHWSEVQRSKMNDQCVTLIAIANPVLDIAVTLRDPQILNEYKFTTDSSYCVSNEVWDSLIKRLKCEHELSYSAGGCALNTVRAFQWLECEKFQGIIAGITANDEDGQLLSNQLCHLHEEGVRTEFTIVDKATTSVSLLLIYEQSRTIVFSENNLQAGVLTSAVSATYFDHVFPILPTTKFVVLNIYDTHNCVDMCQKVVTRCTELNIATVFSISSEAVFHSSDVNQTVIPFTNSCRVLVGNRREFELLCRHLKVDTSDLATAIKQIYDHTMVDLKKPANWLSSVKIIVITDDQNPVHCYTDGEYIQFPVQTVDPNQIVDTTGAGDAFLGGFLYALSKRKPIEKCLAIACRTAAKIIQQQGCAPPRRKPDFLEESAD